MASKRKTKKKVIKKKVRKKVARNRHSLEDSTIKKVRSGLYSAKVLLSSHELFQVGEDLLKVKANRDGTLSVTWTIKFEHGE